MKALCIQDHHIWEGDGEPHRYMGCKKGLVYEFDFIDNKYWVNLYLLPNPDDFLIGGVYMPLESKGLSKEIFEQMFKRL